MDSWIYFNGEIKKYSEVKLGLLTHALHYGTGCFDGLRAYFNKEKQTLFIFRPREHFERMKSSAKLLHIEIPETVEELIKITTEILKKNNYKSDVYIRPIAFKSSEVIAPLNLAKLENSFAIVTVPFGRYIENAAGIKVRVSSWRRIDDNATPARGKITGAYINTALAKTEADFSGADEAIFLNNDGSVSEGSAENIFIVRSGVLYTPSVDSNILEGITRETIIELARDMGVNVVERKISRTELYYTDEIFLTGSGAEIVPVIEVDNRKVNGGKVGIFTQKFIDIYSKMVRGNYDIHKEWLVEV